MPDVGSRKRFAVIRDIVTRVHVVTVRIRDGVTRYALCTHVTPRGSRRVSAVSPTMHHSSVDDSRSLCEKRVIDVRCLHFRVRYAEKREREKEKKRGLYLSRVLYIINTAGENLG